MGQVMGAMCGPVMSLPSGVHPKIRACIQAFSFALDMGFTAMIFEGPSVPFLHNLFARPAATTIEDMWACGSRRFKTWCKGVVILLCLWVQEHPIWLFRS